MVKIPETFTVRGGFGGWNFNQKVVIFHALSENEVSGCELLFDKTALKIEDFGLSGTGPGNETNLQVANLVIILNALAVKSVVLVAGELPGGVLGARESIAIEEVSDGVGYIFYLNIFSGTAA